MNTNKRYMIRGKYQSLPDKLKEYCNKYGIELNPDKNTLLLEHFIYCKPTYEALKTAGFLFCNGNDNFFVNGVKTDYTGFRWLCYPKEREFNIFKYTKGKIEKLKEI